MLPKPPPEPPWREMFVLKHKLLPNLRQNSMFWEKLVKRTMSLNDGHSSVGDHTQRPKTTPTMGSGRAQRMQPDVTASSAPSAHGQLSHMEHTAELEK